MHNKYFIGIGWLGLAMFGASALAQDDDLNFLFDQGAQSKSSAADAPDNVESEPVNPADSEPPTPPQQEVAAPDTPAPDEAETSGAGAKTAAKPQRRRSSRRVAVEEIIVTAQKREENIQDVPISIQAFSGDELAAKGITDPSSLGQVTPGLVYNSIAQFDIIFLRGVGTTVFTPAASPSVATYIDGVFFPFSSNLAKQFGKLKRVEVLKGPQGTLFGRNTTGGAINVVTAPPQDQFEGSLDLAYANFSTDQTKLYLSGPLADTISASVTGLYNTKDEYYDLSDRSPLDSVPSYRQKGLQGKLNWAPWDWFDGTLAYFKFDSQANGTSIVVQEEPTPLGTALGITPPDRDYSYTGNEPPLGNSESEVGIATLNFRPGPFDIVSITGLQDHLVSQSIDFDGSEQAVVAFRSADGIFSESFSQEIQLKSNGSGWLNELFGRPFKWLLGFYYAKTTQGFDRVQLEAFGANSLLDGDAVGGVDFPGLAQIGESATAAGVPTLGGQIELTATNEFEGQAVFGQVTWDLIDWFGLTLGGRLTQEDSRLFDSDTFFVPAATGQDVRIAEFEDQEQTETNFSPKVTLDFKPWDSSLFYGSFQQGFKSGTYNDVNLTAIPDEIDPEEITTIEFGTKLSLFSGQLRFNAAVFRNTIEELQTLVVSVQSGGAVSIENAERARIDGVEIDMNWAITPDLIFNIAGAYLDSEFLSFPDGSGFDQESGIFQDGTLDFTGNRTPRSPEFSGNAGLFYSFDVWRGVAEAGTSVYYNDGFFFDNQNASVQDSYYLLDATLGYLYEPWNVRLTFFGKNLNNAEYNVIKFPFDFGPVERLAEPRTYGARLGWEF